MSEIQRLRPLAVSLRDWATLCTMAIAEVSTSELMKTGLPRRVPVSGRAWSSTSFRRSLKGITNQVVQAATDQRAD